MSKKIALMSVGHGGKGNGSWHDGGANGYVNEYKEVLKIMTDTKRKLDAWGVKNHLIIDTTSTSVNANVNWLAGAHNYYADKYGASNVLHLQGHMNSSTRMQQRGIGTENLHYSGNTRAIAQRITDAICSALGTINRKTVERKDVGFLRMTRGVAVLQEFIFVNSKTDVELYRKNYNKLIDAYAKQIAKECGYNVGALTQSTETGGDNKMVKELMKEVESLKKEVASLRKLVGNGKAGASLAPTVERAVKLGITDGSRMGEPAKREEVVAMITRAVESNTKK